MKQRFPLSAVRGVDVGGAVAAFLAEHAHWREHMRNVAADAEKAPEERTYQAYPAPVPSRLVAQAVEWDAAGVPSENFEVFDDGPTPEEVLAKKRSDLAAAVNLAETAARAAVLSPGKARLHWIKVSDVAAKKAEERTDDEKRFFAAAIEIEKRLDAINRHGAMMHAEIEDLTAETVDGWTMKEFPR